MSLTRPEGRAVTSHRGFRRSLVFSLGFFPCRNRPRMGGSPRLVKVTLRRRTRLSVVGLLLILWVLPKVPVYAADKIVTLTVVVKEFDGKTPIPMARVNVYQTSIAGSATLTTVPDYGEDTNAQGIRR